MPHPPPGPDDPSAGGRRHGSPQLRLRAGFLVIAVILSVFGARLVQLQAIDPHAYAEMAAEAGIRKVTIPAQRGAIVDRDGDPLAKSIRGKMVVADPKLTRPDAQQIARLLARRLEVGYIETLQALQEKNSRFEYVARRVPANRAREAVEAVEEAGYAGIYLRRDPIRTYPAGNVAANLIGFIGEDKPLAGFELTFNEYLSGKDGHAIYEMANGKRIPLGKHSRVPPVDGKDLRLTIDRDLQWFTQRVLRQTVEHAQADSGVAIIMDTQTGEILALADYPTFDASDPLEAPEKAYGSRAVSNVYPPGSVSKVLTAAALIDAGKVTPRTRMTVPGKLTRAGETINDWWDHGTIHLTFAGVIARSSNIGTVLAADQLSNQKFYSYLRAFGLGEKTGIGIRGESAGLLPPPEEWTALSNDRIAFGQSMSVTALQMVAAVNTIANGGVYVEPEVVMGKATTNEEVTVGTATSQAHRVVSARAAQMTTNMMQLVVHPEKGTAPLAAVPGYEVAGKTGTSQRVGEECNCFARTTVSFAGFAPVGNPRFTIYVVVHDPGIPGGGGSIAAPAFSTLMSYTLRKYGVPPAGAEPSQLPIDW